MNVRFFALIVLFGVLSGCGVGEGTGSTPPWADDTPETPVAEAEHEMYSMEDMMPDENVEGTEPFTVRMATTKGDIVIDVKPDWAPRGAARFKELVEVGYYDDNRIFRVIPNFVVQFGMHGDPAANKKAEENRILDDRVKVSNKRGTVTFATSGPNARTTQVFINLSDNTMLDDRPDNFAPFGEVVEGMDVVESFNAEYGEQASNRQPDIAAGGNKFLDEAFPGLDSIVMAKIVKKSPAHEADSADEASNEDTPVESGGEGSESPAD